MNIKAIETRYKGYRFRSRLEARWAVFFDALGLKWEYEPEGFDLGDIGWYLPDFYLSNLDKGTWVEVKPNYDTLMKEKPKYEKLCSETKKLFLIACGTPSQTIYPVLYPGSKFHQMTGRKVFWGECCFNAKYLPPCPHDIEPRLFYTPSGTEDADCFEAMEAARSARFEHGERP